jgi:hypothetical protein
LTTLSSRLDRKESTALGLVNLLASPFLLPLSMFKLGRGAEKNGEIVPLFMHRSKVMELEGDEERELTIPEDEYVRRLLVHTETYGYTIAI